MALDKQNVPISFAQGIDTRTDYKQIVIGKLLSLINAVFRSPKQILKRFGFTSLTQNVLNGSTILNGISIANFKNELLILDGSFLYSYNSNGPNWVNKGSLLNLTAYSKPIASGNNQDSLADSAVLNNYQLFAWLDANQKLSISLYDITTNQAIYDNYPIQSSSETIAGGVKVVTTGNYFILVYNASISGSNKLFYYAIQVLPSISFIGETVIATDMKVCGANIFIISGTASANIGTVYSINSTNVTLTQTALGSYQIIGWANGVLPGAGVLTKVSGTGDSTITYTSLIQEDHFAEPFYLFDATTINNAAIIAYVDSTGKIGVFSLSSSLILSSKYNATGIGSFNFGFNITVFGDSSNNIWLVYDLLPSGIINNFTLYYSIVNPTLTANILGQTLITTSTSIINAVTGIATVNAEIIYEVYESFNPFVTLTNPSTWQDQIYWVPLTSSGTVGSGDLLATGVQLSSKAFYLNGTTSNACVFVNFPTALQTTYFLINYNSTSNPSNILAKFSQGLGGSVNTSSILPNVNQIANNVYQVAAELREQNLPVTDILNNGQSGINTQNGIQSLIVDFNLTYPSKITLGNNVLYSGGFVYMYDGNNIVEHGYHVYPEGVIALPNGLNYGGIGPGASTASVNQLQYVATYEWYDGQGQLHKSAPSIPVNYELTSATLYSFTATQSVGYNYLQNVSSFAGLVVGQVIINPNFPIGTTITNLNIGLNQITLSNVSIGSSADISYKFYANTLAIAFTGNTVDGSNQITSVSNMAHLVVGQVLISTTFPTGTYIVVIGTSSLIVSQIATQSVTGAGFYSADTLQLQIQAPALRLTSKQNVNVVFYRTTNNGTVFYRLGSSPNNPTYESISYLDSAPDAQIIGNPELYTTGGEVENIAAPAVTLLTTYKSRAIWTTKDSLTWGYSKQVIPGSPVEFSDLFTENVDSRIQKITALGVLDEKLILFGPTNKFIIVGDGPAPSGVNNDFSPANKLAGSTGCINQASIIECPIGLIYQDPKKGIWLLDRSLQEQYIGADVQAFNNNLVTSAQIVPNQTIVRLTLDNGASLTYDYIVQQWSQDEYSSAAIDSTIYDETYTYITASGLVQNENTDYTDNGAFIPLSVTTGWMNLVGIEGFMRVYELQILGTYYSPHTLTVNIFTDYNETPKQVTTIPVLSNPGLYQFRIRLSTQKCETLKIQINESQSGSYGQGVSLSGLALRVGIKTGLDKLPATASY